MYGHQAVLLSEVLIYLDPQPGRRYIDATFGAGGHTRALLERAMPDGSVLALDLDDSALEQGRQSMASFGSRLRLEKANFKDVASVATDGGFTDVDGILADIGVSSMLLDDPE